MSAHHTTNGHTTPQHHTNGHAANAHHSAALDSDPATPPKPTGRPRIFDDTMRREVRALVTAGCDLRYAARYVGCGISTLKRELERDPEFKDQIRRAEAGAAVHPLVAMHQAASTHWRAAWMLERTMPERFARRPEKKFGQREARRLIADLIELLRAETMPPLIRERLEKRITALVKHATDTSTHPARTARRLRDALHDSHDRLPGTTPLCDDLLPPMPTNPMAVFDDNYWHERQLWDEALASRQTDRAAAKLPPHDLPESADDPLVHQSQVAHASSPDHQTAATHTPKPRQERRDRSKSAIHLAPQDGHPACSETSVEAIAPRSALAAEAARPKSRAGERDVDRVPVTSPRDTQGQQSRATQTTAALPAPPVADSAENSKVPPPIHLLDESWPEFPGEFDDLSPDAPKTFERKNALPRCAQNSRIEVACSREA